jgi:hypothetical protein
LVLAGGMLVEQASDKPQERKPRIQLFWLAPTPKPITGDQRSTSYSSRAGLSKTTAVTSKMSDRSSEPPVLLHLDTSKGDDRRLVCVSRPGRKAGAGQREDPSTRRFLMPILGMLTNFFADASVNVKNYQPKDGST